MKTRDKILEAALELFNDNGVSEISSRNISEHLGISYGNLTYHFPKKDGIISALYRMMQQELAETFKVMLSELDDFGGMMINLQVVLKVYFKYKFLFLGFAKVNRRMDSMKRDAQMQNNNRKKLLRQLTDNMISRGLLKEERTEGFYDKVIHNMLIILNSSIADAEFFYDGAEENKILYYSDLLYSYVVPHLSQEGFDAFNEYYIQMMNQNVAD